MKKFAILFHKSDNDGKLSGAICKFAMLSKYPDADIVMQGLDHGRDPGDIIEFVRDRHTFMVDFSLEKDIMDAINESASKFIWIDHHATALEKMKYDGLQSTERAGCYLTWQYLFGNKDIPMVVEIIDLWDRFEKSDMKVWEEVVLPFHYGTQNMFLAPDHDSGYKVWDLWLKHELNGSDLPYYYRYNTIMNNGNQVKKYVDNQVARQKYYSFNAMIDGHKAIVLNTPVRTSLSCDGMIEDDHEIVCCYVFNGKEFYCSLYAADNFRDKVNVGKIAEKHGGGGHLNACGGRINRLEDLMTILG